MSDDKVILNRTQVADFVLRRSADFFGMQRESLKCSYIWKDHYKKKMVMKVMSDELDYRFKEVAYYMGYSPGSDRTIYYHVKVLSDDMENNKNLRKIYKQLLIHLKLQDDDKASNESIRR